MLVYRRVPTNEVYGAHISGVISSPQENPFVYKAIYKGYFTPFTNWLLGPTLGKGLSVEISMGLPIHLTKMCVFPLHPRSLT